MKFWRRRKPLNLPADLTQSAQRWDGPEEVIHDLTMDKIIAAVNENVRPAGKIPLKDKITMTTLRS